MKPNKELHEINRLAWNAATVAHNSQKADQDGFLRRGGSTLFPEELELLGDVSGKSIVHMQCNSGQDSLSLVRLGAVVTGVDISDEAIDFATELSVESELPATFVRSDLFDWFDTARDQEQHFDIAFCSYGATCWLCDLKEWGRGIFDILKPGGQLVAVEFHPVSMMFDEKMKLTYPYFGNGKALKWEEGVSDYVAYSGSGLTPSGVQEGVRNFKNPHPVYEFPWSMADILSGLISAGLTIEQYKEYPYANGAKIYDDMLEATGRRMLPPQGTPELPMMYGLSARKS
jgi:SAM-dependent methyltransferase